MEKEKIYWNKELDTLNTEEKLSLTLSNPEDFLLSLQLFNTEIAIISLATIILQGINLYHNKNGKTKRDSKRDSRT